MIPGGHLVFLARNDAENQRIRLVDRLMNGSISLEFARNRVRVSGQRAQGSVRVA